MTEPCDLTACEATTQIEAGDLTAEGLVTSCVERIAVRDGVIKAWTYIDAEKALDEARKLDAGPSKGPLHGIPFGVKDIIETVDMPTAYGSPIYEGNRTTWDAACVALTRIAGGILMGKTVSTEFAHRFPGKTTNPHNPEHTPGGSSSGSAAAVASGMIPIAIGTQTGGSGIRPASFCGIVGYKATFGDFSLFGVREQTRSFDTLTLYARTIDDIALFRDVQLRQEPKPLPDLESFAKLRIGFCRTPYWERAEVSTQSLLEQGAQSLAKAGARITDLELPPIFRQLHEAAREMSGFEFARCLTYELTHHTDLLSTELREGRAADGLVCTYEQYSEARKVVAECRLQIHEVMADFDLLLAPSAIGEAPKGLRSTGDAVFNRLWNDTYVPAVTIPAFTGPHGLPIGAQLVGQFAKDGELLAKAKWVACHIT